MRPPENVIAFVEQYAVEGGCAEFLDFYATLISSPDCLLHFPDAAVYLLIDRCENSSASLHFIAWNRTAPHFLKEATARSASLARARWMKALDFAPPASTLTPSEIEPLGYLRLLSTYAMALPIPEKLTTVRLPAPYRFASLAEENLRTYYEAAHSAFRDNPETRIPDFEAFAQRTRTLEIKPEILFHGDAVVGFTKILPQGEIVTIGVVPNHRGKSLGKALAYRALEILRARGIRQATLTVHDANSVALSLYEKMGFVKNSEQVTYSLAL